MPPAARLIRDPRLASVDYAHLCEVDAPMRTLWTAGACPLDARGETVGVGDYVAQTHQVMRNLTSVLETAGASLTDIVRTTVYVASAHREDLGAAWRIYRQHMNGHDVPSTLVGVTVLGYDDQLVEVDAVAVVAGEGH